MSAHDLELVRLRKVYPGGTVAVEAFDLQVARGEFITFVGPSGCGKTTTLRMIAGLESITSGELLIRGKSFADVPAEKRPTATIFQNYAIFPHTTVRQNIAFGLEVRKIAATDIKRRVDAMIEKMELGDVADSKETSLSGGQRQRLSLARGLVTEPDILLLDEPLGALDANLRKSIQEEIKLLQRDLNITFVFVTHAQSEALSLGDRVVVMNAGKVEQISPSFELYTRPKTPFVARFIGRNKMIEGTLAQADTARAVVSTRFGELTGVPNFNTVAAKPRAEAIVVVPSEYVELHPKSEDADRSEFDVVDGVMTTLDAVGQVVHTSIWLDETLTVRLETHPDQIAGRGLAPGAAVSLRWRPKRATVVLDTD